MKTVNYERPREKLQHKGISALTIFELLQIIIGSGTSAIPVTKIARKLYKALSLKGVTISLEDLTSISGLGLVKAGQIMAGLELAYRLYNNQEVFENGILGDIYDGLRMARKQTIMYAFLNGRNEIIHEFSLALEPEVDIVKVVRSIFSEALSLATASISIAIGYKNQSLDPGVRELEIMRNIYSTAKLLSISVHSFLLIKGDGTQELKEINYE